MQTGKSSADKHLGRLDEPLRDPAAWIGLIIWSRSRRQHPHAQIAPFCTSRSNHASGICWPRKTRYQWAGLLAGFILIGTWGGNWLAASSASRMWWRTQVAWAVSYLFKTTPCPFVSDHNGIAEPIRSPGAPRRTSLSTSSASKSFEHTTIWSTPPQRASWYTVSAS